MHHKSLIKLLPIRPIWESFARLFCLCDRSSLWPEKARGPTERRYFRSSRVGGFWAYIFCFKLYVFVLGLLLWVFPHRCMFRDSKDRFITKNHPSKKILWTSNTYIGCQVTREEAVGVFVWSLFILSFGMVQKPYRKLEVWVCFLHTRIFVCVLFKVVIITVCFQVCVCVCLRCVHVFNQVKVFVHTC